MRRTALPIAMALAALTAFAAVPLRAQPQVVRYEPKDSDLKYVYGPAPPVATLRPGDILETRTADCFGNVIHSTADSLAKVKGGQPADRPVRDRRSRAGR